MGSTVHISVFNPAVTPSGIKLLERFSVTIRQKKLKKKKLREKQEWSIKVLKSVTTCSTMYYSAGPTCPQFEIRLFSIYYYFAGVFYLRNLLFWSFCQFKTFLDIKIDYRHTAWLWFIAFWFAFPANQTNDSTL